MAKKKKSLLGQLGRAMTPLATGYALGRGVPAELLPSYQSRAEQQRRKELRQREKFAVRAEGRADERQAAAEQRAMQNQLELTRRLAEVQRAQVPLDTQADLESQSLRKEYYERQDESGSGKKKRSIGKKDSRQVSSPSLSPTDDVSLSSAPQVSMRPDVDGLYNPLRDGLRPFIEQDAARDQFAMEASGFPQQQDPFSFLGSSAYPVDPDAARGFQDSDDPVVIRKGLVQQAQGYKTIMQSLSPEGRGKASDRLKVIEQAKAGRPSASQELIAQLAVLEEEDPIEQYQVRTPTVQEEVESGAAFTDSNGTFIRKANGELSFNPTLRNTELKLGSQERQQQAKIDSEESKSREERKEERKRRQQEAVDAMIDSYGGVVKMRQTIADRLSAARKYTVDPNSTAVDIAIEKELEGVMSTSKKYGIDIEEEVADKDLDSMRRFAVQQVLTQQLDLMSPEGQDLFGNIMAMLGGEVSKQKQPSISIARPFETSVIPSEEEFANVVVPEGEERSQAEDYQADVALSASGRPSTEENRAKQAFLTKSANTRALNDLYSEKDPELMKFMGRSKGNSEILDNLVAAFPSHVIDSLQRQTGLSYKEAIKVYLMKGNEAHESGEGIRHLSMYPPEEQANLLSGSTVLTGDQTADNQTIANMPAGEVYITPDGTIFVRKPDDIKPEDDSLSGMYENYVGSMADAMANSGAFAAFSNLLGGNLSTSPTLGRKKKSPEFKSSAKTIPLGF